MAESRGCGCRRRRRRGPWPPGAQSDRLGAGRPCHTRVSVRDAVMATHELKSWPSQFQAMWTGRKRAEFRRDDRGYQVGDLLDLREWDPEPGRYTGFRL